MGAFAAPAAVREALTEGIRKGGIKDVGDLLHRSHQSSGKAPRELSLARRLRLLARYPLEA